MRQLRAPLCEKTAEQGGFEKSVLLINVGYALLFLGCAVDWVNIAMVLDQEHPSSDSVAGTIEMVASNSTETSGAAMCLPNIHPQVPVLGYELNSSHYCYNHGTLY